MEAQLGVETEHGKCIVAIVGHTYVLIQAAQTAQALQVSVATRVRLDSLLTRPAQRSMPVQLVVFQAVSVITQLLQEIFQVAVDQADTVLVAVIKNQPAVLAPPVI